MHSQISFIRNGSIIPLIERANEVENGSESYTVMIGVDIV